jgi:hypothetical protein
MVYKQTPPCQVAVQSPPPPPPPLRRYLSHSWVLSLFLDCPTGMGWTCPNATEVELVTQAIQQGAITWHAMPFNPQYEVKGQETR